MATWLPSNQWGSGQPHIMCPMEKYIRTMRNISEAMSRFFSFGVSWSAGTVARILYRLDDGGGAGGALHAHGVRQQTDRAACDAGNGVHGLFHPCRAGRAAHAGNIVLFHNRTPEDRLACPQEGHFISFGSNLISSSSFSSLPARRSSATQVRTCWASSSLEKPFSAEFTAATCTRMSAQ